MSEVECPQCGSTQIMGQNKGFGLGKAAAGGLLLGPVGLLGGLIGSKKIMVSCLSCGYKWDPAKLAEKKAQVQAARERRLSSLNQQEPANNSLRDPTMAALRSFAPAPRQQDTCPSPVPAASQEQSVVVGGTTFLININEAKKVAKKQTVTIGEWQKIICDWDEITGASGRNIFYSPKNIATYYKEIEMTLQALHNALRGKY